MKRVILLVLSIFCVFSTNAQEQIIEGKLYETFSEHLDDLGGIKGKVVKTHPFTKNVVPYNGAQVWIYQIICKSDVNLIAFSALWQTGEYQIDALRPGVYKMEVKPTGVIKYFIVTPNSRTHLPTINITTPLFPFF